jgi:hypothetical protein
MRNIRMFITCLNPEIMCLLGNPSASEIDILELDLCDAEQATFEKAIRAMSCERRNSPQWCAAHKVATQSIMIMGNIKSRRRIK